jgi:hypothetical protein
MSSPQSTDFESQTKRVCESQDDKSEWQNYVTWKHTEKCQKTLAYLNFCRNIHTNTQILFPKCTSCHEIMTRVYQKRPIKSITNLLTREALSRAR